jgi:hypothetical protein
MIEEWRTIKEFPDYEISNLGRIRRLTTQRRWKAGHIRKISSNGRYPNVSLYKNGRGYMRYIHRLVMEAFVGTCPPNQECNHKDGNRMNFSLDNLEWITHSENEIHAHNIGLKRGIGCPGRVGERHPLHKLKDGEVWLIKKILAAKRFSFTVIARMFKVAPGTISKIKLGTRWGHIVYEETSCVQ